jgi:glucosyltransferase
MIDMEAKSGSQIEAITHSVNSIYLSFVVPSFNEESAIPLLYNDISKICVSINGNYEIIFIDDGSRDNTLNILRQIANGDKHTHYISLSRNFGKEAAMLAGLQATQGEYVVILDADGQDPPSIIPQMLETVVSGECDCVATRRITRTGEPLVRSFFARCFYTLMKKITDIEIVDGARDFRLMNRKYLDALLMLSERNRFSKGIFPWIGFKTKWLEYENIERKAGKTKWSFWKLLIYSMDGIIAFSTKPLALASLFGVLLFFASFVSIAIVVIRKLIMHLPDTGYSSVVCIVLFVSGIQLFTIGILGQYIAKSYIETKQRPHYVIKEER